MELVNKDLKTAIKNLTIMQKYMKKNKMRRDKDVKDPNGNLR